MKIDEHQLADLRLIQHRFTVPLDHTQPGGERIEVFAREVRDPADDRRQAPWLLFLQGGPGFAAARPTKRGGWIKVALESGHRVLLLDQRGTGRSTPVTHRTLRRFVEPSACADYLRRFRADAIVRDCELVRSELLGAEGRWKVLGQSFGGFCLLTYLSYAPEHIEAGFFTGGLPKLDAHADDVYRRTYPACAQRSREYFARYPEDAALVRDLALHLEAEDVRLGNGERLSTRRLRQLGLLLGASEGMEELHYLLETAFVRGRDGLEVSTVFRRGFENALHWDTNPLYAVLHEACYAQGRATAWSAHRLLAEFPEFTELGNEHLLFTGEMIYPWMFDEIDHLRPLRDAARRIAALDDWPALYDADRLARNEVPCAAAVYLRDMYVPLEFSRETAALLPNLRVWESAEHEHNGLRADGENVFGKLLELLASTADR